MISFLQSNEWERFQKSLGRKTWRIDGVLIIQHELPLGLNYLYCPRPALITEILLDKVQELARGQRSIFFKIDPLDKFQVSSFRLHVSKPLQPRNTVMLDLSKSEEELRREMHQKTRYNIRIAERKGVVVHQSDDLKAFWDLLQETVRRGGFHTHERQYYEKLLAIKSKHFSNELFFAEYHGKALAAALINWYAFDPAQAIKNLFPERVEGLQYKAATYLHGASSREHKEAQAAHLLHWRIIQEARRRGFSYYDFWGIDEEKWPGITRFKRGFGGKLQCYPATFDIIYRPLLHALYCLVRRIPL